MTGGSASFLSLLLAATGVWNDDVPLRDGSTIGSLAIVSARHFGESLVVRVRFRVESGFVTVRNPLWVGDDRQALNLFLVSSDGDRIESLRTASRQNGTPQLHALILRTDNAISRDFRFPSDKLNGRPDCYVQAELDGSYFSVRPPRKPCRSAAVKITKGISEHGQRTETSKVSVQLSLVNSRITIIEGNAYRRVRVVFETARSTAIYNPFFDHRLPMAAHFETKRRRDSKWNTPFLPLQVSWAPDLTDWLIMPPDSQVSTVVLRHAVRLSGKRRVLDMTTDLQQVRLVLHQGATQFTPVNPRDTIAYQKWIRSLNQPGKTSVSNVIDIEVLSRSDSLPE